MSPYIHLMPGCLAAMHKPEIVYEAAVLEPAA